MAFTRLESQGQLTITDTTTDVTLTDIGATASVQVRGLKRLLVSFGLSGGSVIAVDQFAILGSVDQGVSFQILRSVFTSLTGILLEGDDLASTAHGATDIAIIDVEGLDEIKFQSAQAGVTAVAVTRTLNLFGTN